jgi:hypothetical protein
MSNVIDLPHRAAHRQHARVVTALMGSVLSGSPVIGIQAQEATRFLNGLAAAINANPKICGEIEEAARSLR